MGDLLEEIRQRGLCEETESEVVEMFGDRGKKAIACAKGNRVAKYLDFYVVRGKTADYVIAENFCTCQDYFARRMKKGDLCYHIIAAEIAEAAGLAEEKNEWYFEKIMQEWDRDGRC